ncbi:molybdopterin molybdotransferase MoeA [uncultured Methanospirillum sp.]|uniref:molybdopterin molybdotransferase MoeA n=1 Tax=uncultured Methanospirillum sp. TaxID=262503 RepID=UPI0029C76FBF|nr:molybdopterin molybdotransferase MoeA [uncultured Methanospirillum sp.]
MIIIPQICINSQLISLEKAKEVVLSSFKTPETDTSIPVPDSCGHVIAQSVYSQRTIPPCTLAGPDGIAVRSEETAMASIDSPVEVEVPRVNTGMPLPDGYDAVIAVEEITQVTDTRFLIHRPVSPFQNTISEGVDIKKGDLLFDKGHVIRPFDIGAMLSYGILEVTVRTWKVGIVATGDEIISPYSVPQPGQIVDSNSYMIAAFLKQYHIIPVLYPALHDEPAGISQVIDTILQECDIALIFGGSSAGSKDYTVDAMEQSGTLLFHGVAMGPGKPVTLARVNDKPVFGMPGPSVSTMVALHELVVPLLVQCGVPIPSPQHIRGALTRPVLSIEGFDTFRMVTVKKDNGKILVTPIPQVFGHMMGIRADGVLHKKAGEDTSVEGQEVEVKMIVHADFGYR